MATKASKLEDDLVEFVESHPETFSEQDVKNLRRSIIIFYYFFFSNCGTSLPAPTKCYLFNIN